MNRFRFIDWQVYKDSKTFFNVILKIVQSLPKEYRYEIGSQLIRAGLSVVLNIAEGSGKHSDAELNRFFDISLGSLYECYSAIDILRDNGFVKDDVFIKIDKLAVSISDQIGGFKKKIRN